MKKYNYKYYLKTGTIHLKKIIIPVELDEWENPDHQDITSILDGYIYFNYDGKINKYGYNELLEDYTDDEIMEEFFPINGGEYWIDGIYKVDIQEVIK